MSLSSIKYLLPFVRNTVTGGYLPNKTTQFVIVYLPRTGSNHLATLLDSHPAILCHHEVFNPTGIHRSLSYKDTSLSFGTVEERDLDPWAFMGRLYSFTDGAAAVGFKLGPVGPYTWSLLSLLLSHRVYKIVLGRRSWLQAYTSVLIARTTQLWGRSAGTPRPNDQVKVRVDPDAFRRFVRKRRAFYLMLSGLLASTRQPRFFLDYEDIDEPATRRALLRCLGVDTSVPLTSKTLKQNSPSLEHRVDNLEELRAALTGTAFAAELDAPA